MRRIQVGGERREKGRGGLPQEMAETVEESIKSLDFVG